MIDLRRSLGLVPLIALLALPGCVSLGNFGWSNPSERECLVRAMYFESNRSSPDGMLAVGTVVMNRVADPRYPSSVCGVVGQKNQFAPGVLSKQMTEKRSLTLATQIANSIMNGQRHQGVRAAQHFHQAGLTFPYDNMHYVLVAGGNAFYEKR
jgi:spore germination cell wall hydrolase CwlJ-like protein